MSQLSDNIETDIRDEWWEQGEVVMREMTDDEIMMMVVDKTAELIKKYGFDKTLKELEEDND